MWHSLCADSIAIETMYNRSGVKDEASDPLDLVY